MTEVRHARVPEGLDGMRLDSALSKMFGFSRSAAVEIISSGGVDYSGQIADKAERVVAGAEIRVEWKPKEPVRVTETPVSDLTVVYDDDDLVVVDKPAGVAAHPSVGWTGPTVLGALLAAGFTVSTSGASERTGIVHRLDAGTSGLMVVAKSELAYSALKLAFRNHDVEKIYHAVVQGHPDPSAGTIDAPIGRHPRHQFKFAITSDGKPSVTHYSTIEAFPAASLLEIVLETGRTHQIRVHMAAQRHPCVGDGMYGADPKLSATCGLTRQWLHATRLSFAHPRTSQTVTFESRYPHDLTHALDVLRG